MGDEENLSYGLVMPFVCVTSKGGPYDDAAFVAGATVAYIDTELEYKRPVELARYVPPTLVAQLDLVAMRNGYTLTSSPWVEHPDEWALARFVRASGRT